MNGPDHYREAERMIDMSGSRDVEGEPPYYAAVAQAHATLALAAATVDGGDIQGSSAKAWQQVTR